MRISDWSSDVCSSDRRIELVEIRELVGRAGRREGAGQREQHHALALEVVVGGLVLPAEGIRAFDGFVAHAGTEGKGGKLSATHMNQIGIAPCREGYCQYV